MATPFSIAHQQEIQRSVPPLPGEPPDHYRRRILNMIQTGQGPWAHAANVFADPAAQAPNESDLSFGVRTRIPQVLDRGIESVAHIVNPLTMLTQAASQLGRDAMDSPAARAQRAAAAAPPQPHQVFAAYGSDGPATATPTGRNAGTTAPASQPAAPVFASGNSNLTIVRNNNPGAIEDGPFARSQPGYVAGPGRFAHFATPEAGVAAQEALLRTPGYRGRTLRQINDRYTPPSPENPPEARANYLNYTAQRLGIGPDTPVPVEMVPQLAAARREWETGNHHGGYSAAPLSAGGLPAPYINPFDPTYGNAALGEVNNAEHAMLQPETFNVDRPAAPEMPAPTPLPHTDFRKADAALEALRPQEFSEKERLSIQRRGIMAGLGQALLHMPAGAGLGQVLAMAGGGALAGRAQGDQEASDRMDRFETRMAQFNTAVYAHETDRAQTIAHEAQADAQQLNNYALARWQTQMQSWRADNAVSVTDGAIVAQHQTPTGLQITRTPIASAVRGAMALQRAHILSGMGSEQNAGNAQVSGAANSFIAAQAAQAYQQGHAGSDQALLAAPAFMAAQAVQYGRVGDVLGSPAEQARLQAEVNGRMTASGWQEPQVGGDATYARQYRDHFNELMVEALTRLAAVDPNGEFQRRLFAAGGGGAAIQQSQRYFGRRETSTTNARGQTTTSTSTDGNDN